MDVIVVVREEITAVIFCLLSYFSPAVVETAVSVVAAVATDAEIAVVLSSSCYFCAAVSATDAVPSANYQNSRRMCNTNTLLYEKKVRFSGPFSLSI